MEILQFPSVLDQGTRKETESNVEGKILGIDVLERPLGAEDSNVKRKVEQ